MATSNQATWKRLFDSMDRTVGSRVNEFARSEDIATVAALRRRAQSKLGQFTERASRRRGPARRPRCPARRPSHPRPTDVAVGFADPTAVLGRLR